MQPSVGSQLRVNYVTSGNRNLRARRETAERRDEIERGLRHCHFRAHPCRDVCGRTLATTLQQVSDEQGSR